MGASAKLVELTASCQKTTVLIFFRIMSTFRLWVYRHFYESYRRRHEPGGMMVGKPPCMIFKSCSASYVSALATIFEGPYQVKTCERVAKWWSPTLSLDASFWETSASLMLTMDCCLFVQPVAAWHNSMCCGWGCRERYCTSTCGHSSLTESEGCPHAVEYMCSVQCT